MSSKNLKKVIALGIGKTCLQTNPCTHNVILITEDEEEYSIFMDGLEIYAFLKEAKSDILEHYKRYASQYNPNINHLEMVDEVIAKFGLEF